VLKLLAGKPSIHRQIERVKRISSVSQIVLATSLSDVEKPLCEWMREREKDVLLFRGSEEDVLERFYQAASQTKADVIMRITGDCPLLSPNISGAVLQKFLQSGGAYDYVSNVEQRTYPRGLDTEVFSMKVLEQAYKEASSASDREHVTPYIRKVTPPERIGNVENKKTDDSRYRWTLDTEEDYRLISAVYDSLYSKKSDFEFEDVLKLFQEKPELAKLNAHIQQKEI